MNTVLIACGWGWCDGATLCSCSLTWLAAPDPSFATLLLPVAAETKACFEAPVSIERHFCFTTAFLTLWAVSFLSKFRILQKYLSLCLFKLLDVTEISVWCLFCPLWCDNSGGKPPFGHLLYAGFLHADTNPSSTLTFYFVFYLSMYVFVGVQCQHRVSILCACYTSFIITRNRR